MIRPFIAFAILALSVSLPANAYAQPGAGVAAGMSIPRGDFDAIAESGYHVAGLLTFGAPLAPVGLRVEASFSEYDYRSTLQVNGSKARIISGTANAVLTSPGLAGPYAIGGVGYYRATAECTGCNTLSVKLGFNGGLGFKLALTGFSTFVEARYHYLPGPSDPTTAGIRSSTQFIPISVGVTF